MVEVVLARGLFVERPADDLVDLGLGVGGLAVNERDILPPFAQAVSQRLGKLADVAVAGYARVHGVAMH